jgi:kumamolisin
VSFDRVALASGRIAFANTQAPQFDASVAGDVQGVVGLDSISVPGPHGIVRPHGIQLAHSVAAPSGHVSTGGPQPCSQAVQSAPTNYAYTADQIASAYRFSSLYGAGDEGAGQTIALFELEPNSPSDIAAYQACYGTNASVSYAAVDGGAGSGSGGGEAALDIEDVIGLAPKANVIVYQGPNSSSGAYDTYAAIVSRDRAQVISTSWGLCEPDEQGTATAQSENTLFQEAAAQGQSIFAAAGDDGSEDCQTNSLAVDDPASQPYVTGVGGTALSTLGPPPAQSVWNESSAGAGAGGGGISAGWSMPSYQATAPQSLNVINGSSSGSPCNADTGGHCREVPDVSADADPYTGYLIYYRGGWTGAGGTSAAAPLWAAFMALVNASSACGGIPVGFANPALYAAAGSRYASDFGDITAGNNDYTGTNRGAFAAGLGYDMASGLGTPIGSSLPSDLCAYRDSGGSRIEVTNPGPQIGSLGSAASLQIAASDSNSAATLTYAASGLPSGLSLGSATGLISGSPAATGTFAVTVTVSDATGASSSASFTWTVTTRATATSVFCSPGTLLSGATTTCTATASDAAAGTPSTPAGTIRFASSGPGAFSGAGSCTLAQASAGTASCSVTYQPLSTGAGQVTAGYSGDVTHSSSSATSGLTVSAPPAPPSSPAAPPPLTTSVPAPPALPSTSAGITGTPRAGSVLSCPSGSSNVSSYQWTRNGTPIVGATSARYRVRSIDEGNTLTCVVTVASVATVRPPIVSASVSVPVPAIPGCPAASGRAAGTTLGLLKLGMTRKQARHAYAHSTDHASRNQDVFCLTPIGLRAGYPSTRLLGLVPRARRGAFAGRVVWIATGSAFFAIDGVRVGTTLSSATRHLRLGKVLAIGRSRWYLAPAGAATIALEVQGRIVQEIGLAARQLTAGRAAQRTLLTAFSRL